MNMLDKIRAKKQMVRAVIYARFSSDNQRDESIDAQIRAISEYAKKNEIVIVGEYIDKARSAMTDNRPEFLRMISEASEQKFDIVLVHKLDRFARNRQDSIGYRMQLKRHGVSLVSVLEYIDESPESIILESVLEAMAEYYSKNLAREVQKGMKENALKGLHTGGKPPFGYDVDPETKKLVINEKEACAVRLIFDRFIEGYGYDKIMNELNAHGYRTKCGNPFGKNSLHGIVRNEKYTGTYIFNRSAAKDVDGKRNNHKNKDDDEIIRLDDAVPAIISKNIFEQVQRKIVARKNNKPSNKAKEVYLLSGKIYCGECGYSMGGNKKMSGRSKTPHVTYRCMGKKNRHICDNKEMRREYIETYVLEKLSEYVFDERLIAKLVKEYTAYQNSTNSNVIEKKDCIKSRINEVTREAKNLINIMAKTGSNMMLERITE
ncbi:MAG: recombinase family protein, partial [Eubacteriales bacterium]|nr:recombinase family protein [Eubacteriales bacterium]